MDKARVGVGSSVRVLVRERRQVEAAREEMEEERRKWGEQRREEQRELRQGWQGLKRGLQQVKEQREQRTAALRKGLVEKMERRWRLQGEIGREGQTGLDRLVGVEEGVSRVLVGGAGRRYTTTSRGMGTGCRWWCTGGQEIKRIGID